MKVFGRNQLIRHIHNIRYLQKIQVCNYSNNNFNLFSTYLIEMLEHPWCYETLVSIGLTTVRSWYVYLSKNFQKKLLRKSSADWTVVIQPLLTISLNVSPIQFFTFLCDKLCVATSKNQVFIFHLLPVKNKISFREVINSYLKN